LVQRQKDHGAAFFVEHAGKGWIRQHTQCDMYNVWIC
jgi:hypothetical protein